MKLLDENLLTEITQRLAAEFQPEEILLFGSHAWGVPQPDSDLDLLVIVSTSDQRPTRRASRAYRCLRGIMAPLDILVKTRAEVERHRPIYASLVSRILEEGKLLYGQRQANPGA